MYESPAEFWHPTASGVMSGLRGIRVGRDVTVVLCFAANAGSAGNGAIMGISGAIVPYL